MSHTARAIDAMIPNKPNATPPTPLASKVQRHLRYCDPFLSVFPTWDSNKNKLILRNKRYHNIVRLSILLQFLIILLQLHCTRTQAISFLETSEGYGITSIFIGAWLLRAEFYPDRDQIPLLNHMCWLQINNQNY